MAKTGSDRFVARVCSPVFRPVLKGLFLAPRPHDSIAAPVSGILRSRDNSQVLTSIVQFVLVSMIDDETVVLSRSNLKPHHHAMQTPFVRSTLGVMESHPHVS